MALRVDLACGCHVEAYVSVWLSEVVSGVKSLNGYTIPAVVKNTPITPKISQDTMRVPSKYPPKHHL